MPKESRRQSRDGLHRNNDYVRDKLDKYAFGASKGWQTKEGRMWVDLI